MINKDDLFPIGIGTWGIGGFAERDNQNNDNKQIESLAYMFSKGMNFFEVSLWSAEGWSAKLMAKAIGASGISRDKIFITESIYTHNNPTINDAEEESKKFLDIFQTNYVDSFQFNYAVFEIYGEQAVFDFIQKKLDSGFTKFVSLTNAPLSFLSKMLSVFGDKFFAHEVGFNFEIRENYNLGIIPFADDHNILTVVYQPLRRNRTANRNWPLLVKLSEKYGVTQNQILINWIVSRGYLPLTKSETKEHIDQYLTSLNMKLEVEDKKQLDEFSPSGYQSPQIYWGKQKSGVRIDQLSNVFDKLLF